jgi:glycosyltransferase involved in cell wall biosynthesis
VLEALASGLPVITTSSTGASGILDYGEDGFVLRKVKDLEELKTAILYFFKEEIRQHASHLGRMKAERHSDQSNFSGIDRVFKNTIHVGVTKDDPGDQPLRMGARFFE